MCGGEGELIALPADAYKNGEQVMGLSSDPEFEERRGRESNPRIDSPA